MYVVRTLLAFAAVAFVVVASVIVVRLKRSSGGVAPTAAATQNTEGPEKAFEEWSKCVSRAWGSG